MRRLIAIVLLVLLPFQAIWAASAPYCQHEQGRASHHLGHHVHVHAHQHDQGHQGGHPDQAAAFLDHDHHCAASLTVLPATIKVLMPLPSPSMAATQLASYRSFDDSRIERPNWMVSL